VEERQFHTQVGKLIGSTTRQAACLAMECSMLYAVCDDKWPAKTSLLNVAVLLLTSRTDTLYRISIENVFGNRALAAQTDTEGSFTQPAECIAQFIEPLIALECEHRVNLVKGMFLICEVLSRQTDRIIVLQMLIELAQYRLPYCLCAHHHLPPSL
jgi:hypothetical protein